MDVHAGCGSENAKACWLCGTRSDGTTKEVGGRLVCTACFRQVRQVAINMDMRRAEAGPERKCR